MPTILKKLPTFLLSKSFHKAFSLMEERLKKSWGVGVRDIWVLLVADDKNRSQKEVADFLGINRNVMVGLVDGLEDKGLLERVKNEQNRREYILVVTKKGYKIVESWAESLRPRIDDVMQPLSQREQEVLFDLLDKYIE